MNEQLRQLALLQDQLARIVDVAEQAGRTASGPAEGVDRTGTVRVRVASDGVPESVRLSAGWRRNGSAGLGPLVMDAAQQAAVKRMSAWATALDRSGVSGKLADLGKTPDGTPRSDSSSTWTPTEQTPPRQPPRALAEIVEDALSALDAVDTTGVGSAQVDSHRGVAAEGKVAVVLGEHGLLSCDVDAHWAQSQDDSRIEAALQAALSSARRVAAAVRSDPKAPDFERRSGELVGELMALLSAPQGFPRTDGGGSF